VGNANFYNETDGRYYADKNFKQTANDNTQYLIDLFEAGGDIRLPEGNFFCTRQLSLKGPDTRIRGVKGRSRIVFDGQAINTVNRGDISAYIINAGYSRTYDDNTAQQIYMEGLEFELKQSDLNSYNMLLALANVKKGSIKDCNFITDAKSENFVTLIDLYSCCKNINIENCKFTNMTAASKGSCIWVRNQTLPEKSIENVTENIIINQCSFKQNSDDEILAVYSSVGVVRKVTVRDSVFRDLSDRNIKVFSAYSSENRFYGTVNDISFTGNKIFSDSIRNFIITVGGPDRKNKVSNIEIADNEIHISGDTDQKCAVIYINDIGTDVDDVRVIRNLISAGNLNNSSGIYNASLAEKNTINGNLYRGIVYGDARSNNINGCQVGITSPSFAKENRITNCRIGISCESRNSKLLENIIILDPVAGVGGIEVKKSKSAFEIQCVKNSITTSLTKQYSFILHSGRVELVSNTSHGPGGGIYKNKDLT